MFNPISTYRIQFNKDFTFKQFDDIIPYLQRLGIQTVYASPIFEATPGSNHGYDTTNPNRINPEIGTLEELKVISKKLNAAGISWIQDIVPNHMAFHENNDWLMDLLKNGEGSTYRSFFDIISEDLEKEPLMVPFLGDDLDRVVEREEIKRVQDDAGDFLTYYDSRWPVRPETDADLPIREVLGRQYYRLCNYQESNEHINYRRFFTVNSLICLNMQHEATFLAFHGLIKELVETSVFQGLRIDHIDGLADPKGYIERLRQYVGMDVYIVAEKILEPGENLPGDWALQGTTGYDFLGLVNQLLTNQAALPKFDRFYRNFSETPSPVHVQVRKKKRDFLFKFMKGELDNLTKLFINYSPKAVEHRDTYRELIAEMLVRCPVYRYYGTQFPLGPEERAAIEHILADVKREQPGRGEELSQLKHVLLGEDLTFYKRVMQFTGPLMAKGVEDTLMYTFNRFIGSNEVGDSPEVFGISVADFHREMEKRQQHWPLALNATATHDTKRGEDARARLAVLTSMKTAWLEQVKEWQKLNEDLKLNGTPDTNDEYFIYQTLVATYPEIEGEKATYASRIQEYLEKALRESKRNSSWDEPDLEYEQYTKDFILALLDTNGRFWPKFLEFFSQVSTYGRATSLAATVLKYGCPGVPDLYQGTELWDLSLVDPDNRRPVDYTLREGYLTATTDSKPSWADLWKNSADGRIKLLIIQKLLHIRNTFPEVFSDGQYVPLETQGRYADVVFSFARRYQNDWLLFVVPLNLPLVTSARPEQIGQEEWGDTAVVLPSGIAGLCTDLLRSSEVPLDRQLYVSDLFKDLPISILHFKKKRKQRGAGILMHLSSLPSGFGIGDFGPTSRTFLNILAEAGQTYWQVLPLNPLSADQSYSPYSSNSVMAGNPLFISPELLVDDGLLNPGTLESHRLRDRRKVDYTKAEKLKQYFLHIAYQNYHKNPGLLKHDFEAFCEKEYYWLDDYALFVVIKKQYNGEPWYQWPEELRGRKEEALAVIRTNQADQLDEVKWQQFIFDRQWKLLRKQARVLGIKFIGDLPFYTSADAADVWANRRLFKIDADGCINGLAGVPPDYFNEDGQLWGMPVYDWTQMAQEDYEWWRARMGKNLELYDYVRLDHFRAFAEYWEVPASASTAKEGSWQKGPGASLFNKLKEFFGELPLIAEDLGEITEDVYALRDQFKLPGMKVLQFAFGDDHADSIHAPHTYEHTNCLVYTGTHDNNTVLGWYKEEAGTATKALLSNYSGFKISASNVADAMIRLSYASIANIAIVPVQDVLSEGTDSRMNIPSSTEENWVWRMKSFSQLKKRIATLVKLGETYGR